MLKEILEEINEGYSVAKFKKFEKNLKVVKSDIEADNGGRVPDDFDWEIDGNLLGDESGLKEYMLSKMGISDAQGWIADRL